MSEALFHLHGMAAGYPGHPVLRAVDLTLAQGERLALLGDNGAGKSTLLLAMTGFVPITSGTLTAFGRACRNEADFRALRARAGLVFQDSDDQLFSPTVLEDVAFGPRNLGQPR
ncbi:MAG TPA: ATP-binding cassette domain-containing protein, partial [Aestuariivirga sp.]|nr:ATP-binding cassette domain-containing protein [Aestuariivirga sp.]